MTRTILIIALSATRLLAADSMLSLADSRSPDGQFLIALNFERDTSIRPTWKGDGWPQIEITDSSSQTVVGRCDYPGEVERQSVVRSRVGALWRGDSQAVAFRVSLTHGFATCVLALNGSGKFVEVPFPNYPAMTGVEEPQDVESGSEMPEGWESTGLLRFYLFRRMSIKEGVNPTLEHRVWLFVSPSGMEVRKRMLIPNEGEPGATDNPGDAQRD